MSERAEPASVLVEGVVARLVAELHALLKRKHAREAVLGGCLRALVPHSPELRRELESALEVLVRRGSFDRPLYGAIVRGLAESRDARACPALVTALGGEDGGGYATLAAAGFSQHSALAAPLAKLAVNRHAHVAFAAEVARVARGESNGAHATRIAPMIKEAHRILLCQELLVAWSWRDALGAGFGAALAALRGAERHLGRWLLLAELGKRAGDARAHTEAESEASLGPPGTRPAWTFVQWALAPPKNQRDLRPSLEVVTRLSDRPTSDKDVSFLFRLAAAGVPTTRPLLRHLTRGRLASENAIRAALHLAREFDDGHARTQLVEAASGGEEALRGLCAASLYDLGEHAIALESARDAALSRQLPSLTFANLVLAAASGKESGALVTEPHVRRIQLGWVP